MNDREFEEWVSTKFNGPMDEVDVTEIAGRILRSARTKARLRRAWLSVAALIGAFGAVWIASMVESLNAIGVLFASTLQDTAHSVLAGRPELVIVPCLLLTGMAALRAIREY